MSKPAEQPAVTLHDAVAALEPGRKGEILAAAADVFAEHGYDAGSMRDIAARVGVTEPALYRHFPGKEALFLALIRIAGGRVRNEGFALIDAAVPGVLRSQLVASFTGRRQALAFYGPVLRSVLSAASHNPTFLEEYRRVVVDPVRERLTLKSIELDTAAGVDAADTTREARVRALMALLVGYFVSSVVLADEPETAIADAVLRVMGWESIG